MINADQAQLLSDIFLNADAFHFPKVIIELNPLTRTVVIRYEDLDDDWFQDMEHACACFEAER